MKYRLEFNPHPDRYQWHIEPECPHAHSENTFGWHTITRDEDCIKIGAFIDAVDHERGSKTIDSILTAWRMFEAGYNAKNQN